MKTVRKCVFLLLAISLLFTACGRINPGTTPPPDTIPSNPTSAPTDPTPTAPTDPTPTAPTDPTPTAPTDPTPTAPTDPTPTAPTDPTPTAPTDPTPTAPTDPTPTAPTDPTPTEPTPTEPAPTEPAPTEPAPVLKQIRLETLPKTEYTLGERLDTSGGVLLCEYTDGSARRINLTSSMVSGFDKVKSPGTYTLTVRYEEKGVVATTTYAIRVMSASLWDGSGTKNDPFLIRNLQDLLDLTTVLNKSGYYYRQVANIDCSSMKEWIVIGSNEHPFRHHIDGGGYTISNLCLDGEAMGLFSWVEGSHFKNMKIVNAHTKDNHRTEENNSAQLPGNEGATAALVGFGEGCSFENCSATVNFKSSNSSTGGLIGAVVLKNEKYTLMKNCHVSGTITGSGCTGGLIGNISTSLSDGDYMPAETITVENCSADVEIIIFTTSTEHACVGGLIGKSFGVKIEKCHTKGSINVISGDIGGLIGDAGNYTDVTRCYSTMDIYASSDNHYGGVSAGGLIGHIYSRSDVFDCYATGNITAPYVEWSPCYDDTLRNGGPWRKYYNPCGSLIGTLEVFKAYSEDQKITVYNCYATGIVNVPNICEDKRVYCHGALIGLVLDAESMFYANVKDTKQKDQSSWDGLVENYIGHFGNNYNIENLRTYYSPINDYEYSNTLGLQNPKYTAVPTWEYVQIIEKAALTNQATFEGWDFENVWIMGANGPELRGITDSTNAVSELSITTSAQAMPILPRLRPWEEFLR